MDRHFFAVGVCPKCSAGRIKVTSTNRPYRHHACLVCGHRWKSLEVVISENNWLPGILIELLQRGELAGYRGVLPEIIAICNAFRHMCRESGLRVGGLER